MSSYAQIGPQRAEIGIIIITQTNLKRLQFGPQKCLKLHIGRKCRSCPELSIDTWKLEKSAEEIKSVVELVDVEGLKHIMEEVDSAKYLGDIIQTDGKHKHNYPGKKKPGTGSSKPDTTTLG